MISTTLPASGRSVPCCAVISGGLTAVRRPRSPGGPTGPGRPVGRGGLVGCTVPGGPTGPGRPVGRGGLVVGTPGRPVWC